MKQWIKEIEIDAPIDYVWNLLEGPLENLQRIMPEVLENNPVKVTDDVVGSVYRQKYKEGKRIEVYDKLFLFFANDKVTIKFCEKVKKEAEADYQKSTMIVK